MENAMSAAVRFLVKGLAAIALICMYAVGMGTTAPAAAHGWHCGWIRGHRHLGACGYYEPGINIWLGHRHRHRHRHRRGRRR